MFAELELTVVESSDVSSQSVIDGQLDLTVVESRDIGVRSLTADEPWDAANGNGPVHTSSPAQQQSRPAQESTKPRFEHGSISSGRPVPHVTANGTTMNGHQGAAVGSTVASAASAGTLRDGCSRRQMSGSVPLNEGPQPPPAILTMPVAVRILLQPCVQLLCWCRAAVNWHFKTGNGYCARCSTVRCKVLLVVHLVCVLIRLQRCAHLTTVKAQELDDC